VLELKLEGLKMERTRLKLAPKELGEKKKKTKGTKVLLKRENGTTLAS
jgi:hypothetical protein